MTRSRLETPFAIYTLLSALVHFTGETYYHVAIGQSLPFYVVDLISIVLCLMGAIGSLAIRRSGGSASGWLAAGWGFALCLNYRAFFSRLERTEPLAEPGTVLYVLGATLILSALALLFALYLARPATPSPRHPRA